MKNSLLKLGTAIRKFFYATEKDLGITITLKELKKLNANSGPIPRPYDLAHTFRVYRETVRKKQRVQLS